MRSGKLRRLVGWMARQLAGRVREEMSSTVSSAFWALTEWTREQNGNHAWEEQRTDNWHHKDPK